MSLHKFIHTFVRSFVRSVDPTIVVYLQSLHVCESFVLQMIVIDVVAFAAAGSGGGVMVMLLKIQFTFNYECNTLPYGIC